MSDWYDEQTDDPLHADRRNFYKVEKWSRDGLRVELMLMPAATVLTKSVGSGTRLREQRSDK